MDNIKIEKLYANGIISVAKIASENFSGMKNVNLAKKWITGNFKNQPRMQYFVVKHKGKILGYVLWSEKSGFRKEAVMELEQIAVSQEFRERGIGLQLIKDSLEKIKEYLKKRGSSLKIIEVTTRSDNAAQNLYEKAFGAKVECTIKDFLRGDEVIMIARKN